MSLLVGGIIQGFVAGNSACGSSMRLLLLLWGNSGVYLCAEGQPRERLPSAKSSRIGTEYVAKFGELKARHCGLFTPERDISVEAMTRLPLACSIYIKIQATLSQLPQSTMATTARQLPTSLNSYPRPKSDIVWFWKRRFLKRCNSVHYPSMTLSQATEADFDIPVHQTSSC